MPPPVEMEVRGIPRTDISKMQSTVQLPAMKYGSPAEPMHPTKTKAATSSLRIVWRASICKTTW
jgi:hypothetical protein